MIHTCKTKLVQIVIIFIVIFTYGHSIAYKTIIIPEKYISSQKNKNANVDSLAFWRNEPTNTNWIIATDKSSDSLLVYDASNGNLLRTVTELNLQRPNGIATLHPWDRIVVVERDSRRIKMFSLPHFHLLSEFGSDILKRPYGITLHSPSMDSVRIWVTDNYMDLVYVEKKKKLKPKKIPELNKLDARVHEFKISFKDRMINVSHVKQFGDITQSSGILYKVETIAVDDYYQLLFIADEFENNIKLYHTNGTFQKVVIGDGLFHFEPEGFALYECRNGKGYWVFVDQGKKRTQFHVFERGPLIKYVATFAGNTTANTDGITITNKPIGNIFPHGALFAVHEDGNVAAFSWNDIVNILNLEKCE